MADDMELLHGTNQTDGLLSCIICRCMLQDPVLLQCLHNACRLCVEEDAAERGGCNVTCSLCNVTTDVTVKHKNTLIDAKIQEVKFQQNADRCQVCFISGSSDVSASAFCKQCGYSLCILCLSEHKKHNLNHSCITCDETTDWSKLYELPRRQCFEHKKELDCICMTCEKPVCLDCVLECTRSTHMQPHVIWKVQDPDAMPYLAKVKQGVEHLMKELRVSSDILHKNITLSESLKEELGIGIGKQKATKKSAVDAVSEAYDEAAFELKECYDTLQCKASDKRNAAKLLQQKVSSATGYCHLALTSGDVIGMLGQLKIQAAHLRDLSLEIAHFKEPLEPSKLVYLNVHLPSDLRQITGAWIGLPKLCTDDPFCAEDDLLVYKDEIDYNAKKERLLRQLEEQQAQLEEQKQKWQLQRNQQQQELEQEREKLRHDTDEHQQQLQKEKLQLSKEQNDHKSVVDKQRLEHQQQLQQLQKDQEQLKKERNEHSATIKKHQALHSPLTFGSKSSSWQFPGSRCWDVAVTADGHVLLAALQDGLKEYDASWTELSCWRPTEKGPGGADDSVDTVDVLDDGRVAVGVYYAQLVVLLRRSSAGDGSWLEDQRLPVLQSPPRRLSVHADLLAVNEDRLNADTNTWVAGGPQLVLAKLCCGQELYRRKLRHRQRCCHSSACGHS